MKRAIKDHSRDFIALLVLGVIASIVALYVLNHQRLRFPVLEPKPFEIKAEMTTGQAITPGQGQTVRVAGVRVGDIAKSELKNGRAIVTLHLDEEFSDLVREDATALLRPKTGLKDMFVELNPGTKDAKVAQRGYTIPVANTLPDVNPDEFLQGLDADTRDYVRLLLDGAGRGLKGRGDDLQEVLRRFEPTYRDLAAVTTEVSKRRGELRRLINSLQRLNTEVGSQDDELAALVQSASRVFRALSSERTNVASTVNELPSTLKQATGTLRRVEELAGVLRPTMERMRPTVRALRAANRETKPFALEAAPRLREDIRPFVREARPLVRDLRPAAEKLVDGEPGLTETFKEINHFYNELSHNPRGREGPEKADRDEGYLFHSGWLFHQVNNLFTSMDAHGPGRPITIGGTCQTLQNTVADHVELEGLLDLSGALTDPVLCGEGSG